MTLSSLSPGQRARVLSVKGPGAIRLRLFEMGFVPGTSVTIRGRAPLGDPVTVALRGYLLSLRLEDLEKIEVKALP